MIYIDLYLGIRLFIFIEIRHLGLFLFIEIRYLGLFLELILELINL